MHYYAQEAIKHFNNCIQSNLSLPINPADELNITCKYLPESTYIMGNTQQDFILRKLKLGLLTKLPKNACHIVNKKNLDIALENVLKIIQLTEHEKNVRLLILQIQSYMQIYIFLENKLDIFRQPFYNEHQAVYLDILEQTYELLARYLITSYKQLQQLPAPKELPTFKARYKQVEPELTVPLLKHL